MNPIEPYKVTLKPDLEISLFPQPGLSMQETIFQFFKDVYKDHARVELQGQALLVDHREHEEISDDLLRSRAEGHRFTKLLIQS